MKIEWSRLAVGHLQALHEHVSADNPTAADALIERIFSALERLEEYPQMGRAGRVEGTRELVIAGTPYVVAYRIHRDQLAILAVLHASRKWPGSF